ncbi:MAG: agmatinase [Gammaproteobacteria bacterium]|nr:agmatinase [Gammaproteobacteria bacterium]
MSREDIEARKEQMRHWYWWGVPTFFKCPWNESPEDCDIALIGVPHSAGNGSTERNQHLGPRSIRHVSGRLRRAHQAFNLTPWEAVRIHDLGDVPLPEANNNEVSLTHIQDYYALLDEAGTRPVSYGGDHAITGPILKALGGTGTNIANGRKLSLVHFDAHRDDYEHMPHWLGATRSAAHWAAYTVREGHVDVEGSVQIGIRGNPMKPRLNPAESDIGYRVLPADEIFEIGIERTIELMLARIGDNPVYISFDLDALDPADAPGVSNLEAGYRGLRTYEAIRILQGLRGRNIVGADIVCPMPSVDNPNQITALTGSVLMFEMLSLMADYLRA